LPTVLLRHILQLKQFRVKKDKRKLVKKAMRNLCRIGFAAKHPTKGGTAYNLTNKGKEYAEKHLI